MRLRIEGRLIPIIFLCLVFLAAKLFGQECPADAHCDSNHVDCATLPCKTFEQIRIAGAVPSGVDHAASYRLYFSEMDASYIRLNSWKWRTELRPVPSFSEFANLQGVK